LISQYQKLKLFNGSALVAEHSQALLKKGYGLANMESNISNGPDTKFRLGSITKQFTATLILQLVEQGKIDLKAPVTRYLPDYPARTGDRVRNSTPSASIWAKTVSHLVGLNECGEADS
jgi:CubicO group peptidase (beta-lactamase class C family)